MRRAIGGRSIILTRCSVAAIAGAVAILLRIRRRPVDPEGSSRYVWALGVLVGLGGIVIAGRIRAYTCDRGRFDDVLVLCMHPRRRRIRRACCS